MTVAAERIESEEAASANVAAGVGKLFRKAREEKKLSIADVARELHIRQLYISSIESGQLSDLPGTVYVIGFLKTYSEFLGLDSAEIIRRLGLNSEIVTDYVTSNYTIPSDFQQKPSRKVLFGSLTVLFVLGCTLYVYYTNHENSLNTAEEISDFLPATQADTPILEAKSTDEPEVETKTTDANPSDTKSSDSKSADTKSHDAKSTESKGAIKTGESEGQKQASKGADETPKGQGDSFQATKGTADSGKTAEASSAAVDSDDPSGITLVAIKDAWVQVMNKTGKTVYVRLMHAGETYDVPAGESHILNTGNGGGIKVQMGDLEIPSLGEQGKVLRGVELSKTGLQQFAKQ